MPVPAVTGQKKHVLTTVLSLPPWKCFGKVWLNKSVLRLFSLVYFWVGNFDATYFFLGGGGVKFHTHVFFGGCNMMLRLTPYRHVYCQYPLGSFRGYQRHFARGAKLLGRAQKFTVNVKKGNSWEKSGVWCSIIWGRLTCCNLYELQNKDVSLMKKAAN